MKICMKTSENVNEVCVKTNTNLHYSESSSDVKSFRSHHIISDKICRKVFPDKEGVLFLNFTHFTFDIFLHLEMSLRSGFINSKFKIWLLFTLAILFSYVRIVSG